MTKAVLEGKSEVAAPALTVPASLHSSLMARLDRLGSAKEVAQIGAAIGREFSDALITALVRKPKDELGSALVRQPFLRACASRLVPVGADLASSDSTLSR
jgi:hypothetical protein